MGSRIPRPVVILLRAAAVVLAVIVVTAVATGWLYWMRKSAAHWPGPRVADALPLDELPGHDRVPLPGYLAAFGAAAVLLGLVARTLRLDRLTAGLSLAAGTGLWLLAVDTFCLFVVRQVPMGEALRTAAGLQGIYLAAALAGAAGAFLGTGARPSGLTPTLLGWLVAVGGLSDLLSALIPHSRHTLAVLAPFAPDVVFRTAHVLLVPGGVLLLITSRGLLWIRQPEAGLLYGQFLPAWRPRYVILQAWADLPRVALAAMAAEGYLPHAWLIRSRGWSAPATLAAAGPGPG